jgi:hypothetical protein
MSFNSHLKKIVWSTRIGRTVPIWILGMISFVLWRLRFWRTFSKRTVMKCKCWHSCFGGKQGTSIPLTFRGNGTNADTADLTASGEPVQPANGMSSETLHKNVALFGQRTAQHARTFSSIACSWVLQYIEVRNGDLIKRTTTFFLYEFSWLPQMAQEARIQKFPDAANIDIQYTIYDCSNEAGFFPFLGDHLSSSCLSASLGSHFGLLPVSPLSLSLSLSRFFSYSRFLAPPPPLAPVLLISLVCLCE